MIKTISLFLILVFGIIQLNAQSYAPVPGEVGSTAMHSDSSDFVAWASSVQVNRGPLDIQNPGLGNATYGIETDAVGVADGVNVVSLGDGGEAIIQFDSPIFDGEGFDFAIFENGFQDNYIELAFVEVSSDGVNYFRFDGVSETPVLTQITNFSFIDCRYIHNLAGKYRANYGTPFDLSELSGITGLDISLITHIKLIDVIGSVDPLVGTSDSQANIINDPYPTAFESGGFDLDGVGVIHSVDVGIDEKTNPSISVFPNPTNDVIRVEGIVIGNFVFYDSNGRELCRGDVSDDFTLDVSNFEVGIYYLQLIADDSQQTIKIYRH